MFHLCPHQGAVDDGEAQARQRSVVAADVEPQVQQPEGQVVWARTDGAASAG